MSNQTAKSRLTNVAISGVLSFLLFFVVNKDAGIVDNIVPFILFIPIIGFLLLAIKNFGILFGVILGLSGLIAMTMIINKMPLMRYNHQ